MPLSEDAGTQVGSKPAPASARISVVGIGEDGWLGLAKPARLALLEAREIVGGERHLSMLPDKITAERVAWPSPMRPLVEELAARVQREEPGLCVLASGDPMLHGVGATLAALVGPERLDVRPAPSAWALACARLGWPAATTPLFSSLNQELAAIEPLLTPGTRLIAYVHGQRGAAELAELLRSRGQGASRMVVLERLGGPAERIFNSTAAEWNAPANALHCVAVEVAGSEPVAAGSDHVAITGVDAKHMSGGPSSRAPGIADELYDTDGQLTKREVRALTISALAPAPGDLLWDVGAGSGSIAIEFCRTEPTAGAIAIEHDATRAARIRTNAEALGAPAVELVEGAAPGALAALPTPTVIFIGGGVTVPGMVEACWQALAPGGRLVVNAVTVESEQLVIAEQQARGGTLTRVEISRSGALGSFSAWRPQLPVVQWHASKPADAASA